MHGATIKIFRLCFKRNGSGQRSRYSDCLRAGRSGVRVPVGGRFSVHVQPVPGAHAASYTMDTRSFSRAKWLGPAVDRQTASGAEVEERIELHVTLYGEINLYVLRILCDTSANHWRLSDWRFAHHSFSRSCYYVSSALRLHSFGILILINLNH